MPSHQLTRECRWYRIVLKWEYYESGINLLKADNEMSGSKIEDNGRCDDSKTSSSPQRILVFQQNRRGESKVEGIREFGDDLFDLEIVSIDDELPQVIDDAKGLLPSDFKADLVLDFLKHPDLSYDLALICRDKGIPVVASGKKSRVEGVITPHT